VTLVAATKVTTPVDAFKVYVPSFAIVTTPSASQVAGDELGVMRHVEEVLKPATAEARPLAPVKVVNATSPPGITDFDCDVAVGDAGAETVGVTVAPASCPIVSATTYFTGDAVPVNVGSGSNVIVPFRFAVYVPSLGTVREGEVQLALAVEVVAQNFTEVASSGASDPAVSFVSSDMT
jgi:hypothetical protein